MLLSLTCSLIAIAFCLLLHFYQHFRLVSCYKRSKSFIDPPSNIMKASSYSVLKLAARESLNRFQKQSCHSCLTSVDNENFDFYPFVFLFYVLFLLILTLSIIIKYICIDNGYIVIDWIIIHCVIITTSLESLFNFYRYYSIKFTTKFMYSPSTTLIFKHFSIYFICFTLIFLAQIHFYYLLFPLVILLYFGYNVFCSYSFCTIFINQYKQSNILSEVADDMIHSVQFMRNTSILSSFMSTILLAMLLCIHNHNKLYYLPLFWSISAFALTLNFVRNRQCLYRRLFKLYQCIQHSKLIPLNLHIHNNKRDSTSMDIMVHSDIPQIDIEGAPKPIHIDESINKCKPTKALLLLGISTPINDEDMDDTIDIDDEEDIVFMNRYESYDKQETNTPLSDESEIHVEQLQLTLKKMSSSEKTLHIHKPLRPPLTVTRTRSISDPKTERDNVAVMDRKPNIYSVSPPTSPSEQMISINGSISDIKHVQSISYQSPAPLLPYPSYQSPNSPRSVSYDLDGIKEMESASKTDGDVVKVLHLLVEYGCYSRKSWMSIQQLQEFQKSNNICK